MSEALSVYPSKAHVTLTLKIQNSGSLPASDIHVNIDFFDKDEEVTEDNRSSQYPQAIRQWSSELPLVFPNRFYYQDYILDLDESSDVELWDNIRSGKAKFRLCIKYASLGRKHETIQTELLAKPDWKEGLILVPVPPQKWE